MKDYYELRMKMYESAASASGEINLLLNEAANEIYYLERAVAAATAKQKLLRLAEITIEQEKLYKELHDEWFDDMCYFNASRILTGCTVDEEGLKNSDGELVCRDGRCMDEPLGYFVEQWSGYCEDDYHGYMYVSIDDKGTFVEVNYQC